MKCPRCGFDLPDDATRCQNCGLVKKGNVKQVEKKPQVVYQDKASFWYALLCYICPLVGVVLYCCWKDKMPYKAKSCGVAALISFVTAVLIVVIVFTFGIMSLNKCVG